MLKILQNIDSKKATQQGDIPVGIIKENKFTFFKFNFYLFYLKLKGALKSETIFGNWSPLKMKSYFYFTLKALFVLEVFKFLSGISGHLHEQRD